MSRIILTLFVLLPWAVFGVVEDYYHSRCIPGRFCLPKILYNLESDSNGQFFDDARTDNFHFQLHYKGITKPNTFEDYFFVYVVLDSQLIAKALETNTFKSKDTRKRSYSTNVLETLINAIVYVGSGEFRRMRQHLYFSSSQCPSKEKNFIHSFTTPVSMFICSSVHHPFPESKFSTVMIYPVMAFETIEAARDVEASLIYFLNDQLLNLDDFRYSLSKPFTQKIPEERHLLAHYALEYMFRFLSIGDDTDKYTLSDIPDYQLHSLTTIGSYGSSNEGKKLLYQGNFLYFFQSQNSQVAIWIQLPFSGDGSDFTMTGEGNTFIVDYLVDHFLVIFKKNANPAFRCMNDNFKSKSNYFAGMSSLIKLVKAIYTQMIDCLETPSENSLQYLLFQRFRAKFEFSLTFMLYVVDERNYRSLSGPEADSNVPVQVPNDLRERLEFAITKFVELDKDATVNDYWQEDLENDGDSENEDEDSDGENEDADGDDGDDDDDDGDNDGDEDQSSQTDPMEYED